MITDTITFDDLDNVQESYSSRSFAAIDKNNDDELLNWLKDELYYIKQNNTTRFEKMKNNILRSKNVHYLHQVYQTRSTPEVQRRYSPNISFPYIRDLIDEKTARLIELAPTTSVIPQRNEESDKAGAKVAKKYLEHIKRESDMKVKLMKLISGSKIMGENFLITRWNPDKGDNLDGNTVFIGDVEHIIASPFELYIEECTSYDKVRFGFYMEYLDTDELKLDYPECAAFIHAEQQENYFDYTEMKEKQLRNKTLVITFWHKKTKHVPQGYECKFVRSKILKKGPLPYAHGNLPFTRLTDVDPEGELHGEAMIELVRGIASQVNNMNNSIVKQINLASHPKWFVDAGSIEESQLGNDVGIVRVKAGANRPVLAQSNPVSPQVVQTIESFEQKFYKLGKSNSVVQGEPPTGVTAFVALQYVSESESRRLAPEVVNLYSVVRDIDDKTLKTAAQFYEEDDRRNLMILGPEGNWEVESLNINALKGDYAVVLVDTSTLPDSKAAKTQYLMDLASQFPDAFEKEQIMEMLGFTSTERFIDEVQRASIAAEAENQALLEGRPIPEPKDYEFHLVHWKAHTKIIQDINFKTKTSPQQQMEMLDHVGATEMLILEACVKNPIFTQKVLMLGQFPLVYNGPLIEIVKNQQSVMMGMGPTLPPPMAPPEQQGPPQEPPI